MAQEYDSSKIPDMVELTKQISEVNKLRHRFWTQLREVRNQIVRYLHAHEINEEEFEKLVKALSHARKEYYENEWRMGRNIPIQRLRKKMSELNLMWSTSQFKEEILRQKKAGPDWFHSDLLCQNCKLPLSGRRRKFCSEACNLQHRQADYKRKRSKKKHPFLIGHERGRSVHDPTWERWFSAKQDPG